MAKILIAGCGRLGQPLGERLAARGHSVTGLRRHLPEGQSPIEYIAADVSRPETLAVLPGDIDQALYILTPGDRTEAAYREVFVEGLANFLAAVKAPVIFVSSTSVYGQQAGEWVDEESATQPGNFRGEVLLEAEKALLDAGSDNTVVRFSGIYSGKSARLLKQLEEGKPIQVDPPYYTNRIHEDDCVGVLEFLLEKKLANETLEPLYLSTDSDPAPMWEIMSFLAAQEGLPEPVKQAAQDGAGQNKRCSNRRLLELGYKFAYASYKEGYAST